MIRRSFLQSLAAATLAIAIRPLEGFGLGQSDITPEIPPLIRSWTRITQVTFPTATDNWGLITHVIIPGDPDIIMPIDQKFISVGDCPRLTLFGDLELEGSNSYARLYSGDEVALGRFTRDDAIEEISGEGYQRGRLTNIKINSQTIFSLNPEV